MAKFKKPNQYRPSPSEMPEAGPVEPGTEKLNYELSPTAHPQETPGNEPVMEICGINGCGTRYSDPAIMKKHKERQHGINVVNLNQPKPRNPNSSGDPVLKAMQRDADYETPKDWESGTLKEFISGN